MIDAEVKVTKGYRAKRNSNSIFGHSIYVAPFSLYIDTGFTLNNRMWDPKEWARRMSKDGFWARDAVEFKPENEL